MRRETVLSVFEVICRLALGGLFMFSAWMKVEDPGVFADAVSRYEILPDFSIGLFSLIVPMLELVAGAALVVTVWTREAALLIVCMLLMFITALVWALARGLEISCGCFGVSGSGRRAEMIEALVRDIVMIPFAVWLMFRKNAWIVPFGRRLRRQFAFAVPLLAALSVGAAVKVSSGPVRPGEWNSDFDAVLSVANRESRPMVLVHVGQRCLYCSRLEKAISGEAFRLWCEDRAPVMAFVRSRVDDDKAGDDKAIQAKRSHEFVTSVSSNLTGFPYVCVYWPQAGRTNRVAFCGRREQMAVKKPHRLLVMDFMAALDRAMGYDPANHPGHKTLSEILKASTIRISVKKGSGAGTVSMKPATGLLPEGATVMLSAKPEKDNVFVCWRNPQGAVVGWGKKLEVHGGMGAGCYVADFKPCAECRPPVVVSPATTSLCTRVFDQIKYAIKIDDACRPVAFRPKKRLPRWLKLNDITGSLTGTPFLPGTNTFEIAVVGADSNRTEKVVKVRLEISERQQTDAEGEAKEATERDVDK